MNSTIYAGRRLRRLGAALLVAAVPPFLNSCAPTALVVKDGVGGHVRSGKGDGLASEVAVLLQIQDGLI